MNRTTKIVILFVLLLSLVLPGTALAKDLQDDEVVAGGSFTLHSGETLDGNLFIFGGAVTLEEDSHVEGDVILMGGTVSIDGRVDGSVVGFGGVIRLGESADVDGDVTTVAATLHRETGANIDGQVITGFQAPFQFSLPEGVYVPEIPEFNMRVSPAWNGLWFLFRTFLWAALAVLIVMFLPKPVERSAHAIVTQPVLTGGVGLLTAIVAPLLLIAIAITIILFPVSLVGTFVLAMAWFLGRIAVGLEVGQRMGQMLNKDWPLAVAAGIGTFALTLVVDAANTFIPCVGWIFPVLVGLLGLGGVLLTRFGSQDYPPVAEFTPLSSVAVSEDEPKTQEDETAEEALLLPPDDLPPEDNNGE